MSKKYLTFPSNNIKVRIKEIDNLDGKIQYVGQYKTNNWFSSWKDIPVICTTEEEVRAVIWTFLQKHTPKIKPLIKYISY